MTITLARLLLVVALVCFAVAWVIAAGVVSGASAAPWGYAGLAFLAGSFLP